MSPQPGIRIGIDVGGTFTDFVLVDTAEGRTITYKEPSTPANPYLAVASGFDEVIRRAGVGPEKVEIIAHGTTIGLNAIIQRRGADTALVVSRGCRDILEIARSKTSDPFNFLATKEVPLVPRSHVIETSLRLGVDGEGELPSEGEIREIAGKLSALGVASCALTVINGYRRPDIEQTLARRINQAAGIPVVASCAIWPQIREYERTMAALMNAYILPLMGNYFDALTRELASRGFAGRLLIATSNGGTLPIDVARERPIDTILSGPAAGVVAASRFAGLSDYAEAVTVDMGGTSSDMSVLRGMAVEYSNAAHAGDFPLFMPVVSVSAIGAGGGSILWVDEYGVLKVGPHSAGAHPGPVCYGQGGVEPTITDCYLVCGILSRERLLGGKVDLSYEAARDALADIGEKMGMAGGDVAERAAWSGIRVATAKMATELRKSMAERGLDHQHYVLVPFGGAGPTHAAMLAEEARLGRIVIESAPGTFCAMGALLSDLKRDFSRTVNRGLDRSGGTSRRLAVLADELRAEADQWLEAERRLIVERRYRVSIDMKYRDQAYELQVEVPLDALGDRDEVLIEAFNEAHRQRYGYSDAGSAVYATAIQLTAVGRLERIPLEDLVRAEATVTAGRTQRPVFYDGAWQTAKVVQRGELSPGDTLQAIAIVEQEDTTSLIPPGWRGTLNAHGMLILERI